MKVLLLATHDGPLFQNMLASLKRAHIVPRILGWKQQWKGWKWRLEQYKHACEELMKDKNDELVVIVDAFDALCFRSDTVLEFEKMFASFHADIVFSAEWWCANKKNCGKTNLFTSVSNETSCFLNDFNQYVNAGFVVGKAKNLFEMYSEILLSSNAEHFDDQLAISQWINNTSQKIELDRMGLLCKTVHVFDNSFLMHEPFFVHFPGPMLKLGLFPHYNKFLTKINLSKTFYTPDRVTLLFSVLTISLLVFVFYRIK